MKYVLFWMLIDTLTDWFYPLLSSMWNNVVNAWWPLVFYPATDAPRFHKGMIAMICVSVATLGATWLVWYLEKRERRIKAEASEVDISKNELGRLSPQPSI